MTRFDLSLGFISENLNPDSITNLLGIYPTSSHRKGDLFNNRNSAVRKHSAWAYSLRSDSNVELMSHLDSILKKLTSVASEILRLKEDNICAVFTIGVFAKFEMVDISLSNERLLSICKLGGSIDISYYWVKEDSDGGF